jgi:hypothetical protein
MPKETRERRVERWRKALKKAKVSGDFTEIVENSLLNYSGDFTVFETAVGAFFLGHYIGMRPLLVIHNNKTILKYESILGIKFRDYLPDTTKFSDKSIGYSIALRASDFWAAATGAQRIEGRKLVGIEELEQPVV